MALGDDHVAALHICSTEVAWLSALEVDIALAECAFNPLGTETPAKEYASWMVCLIHLAMEAFEAFSPLPDPDNWRNSKFDFRHSLVEFS